jgi:hypothetical protein
MRSSRDAREDVAPGTTTALREKEARIREQDRQWKYNVTLRRVRETTVAMENQKYYYISLCVCVPISQCMCVCMALVIQHAKRMCRIKSSFLASLALP